MHYSVCEVAQTQPPVYIVVFLSLFLVFLIVDFSVTTFELFKSAAGSKTA